MGEFEALKLIHDITKSRSMSWRSPVTLGDLAEILQAFDSEQEKASECPECHRAMWRGVIWHRAGCGMVGTVDIARKPCDSSPKPPKRSCRHCKHKDLLGNRRPCSSCMAEGKTEWEPQEKPEPKPDWKVEAGAAIQDTRFPLGGGGELYAPDLAAFVSTAHVLTTHGCFIPLEFVRVTKAAVPEVGDYIATNTGFHGVIVKSRDGHSFAVTDGYSTLYLTAKAFTIVHKADAK